MWPALKEDWDPLWVWHTEEPTVLFKSLGTAQILWIRDTILMSGGLESSGPTTIKRALKGLSSSGSAITTQAAHSG